MGILNMRPPCAMEPASPSSLSASTADAAPTADAAATAAAADGKDDHTLVVSKEAVVAVPRMRKVETFEEKLYRKFTEEPLVPIGCCVTAYFLGSGIKSFFDRDAARSQRMMRARVGAQFATIACFVGYYGISSFNFEVRPGYDGAATAAAAAATATNVEGDEKEVKEV